MRIAVLLFVSLVFCSTVLSAQFKTARNVDRNDCNGQAHNFYTELDSGDVLILEYIMTCSACSNAEHKVESMLKWIDKQHPGRIRFYQFAYTNSYGCDEMKQFVLENTMKTIPFDSGASDVAYYGGFGMPTFVILAGKDHRVLYTGIGFSTSDTSDMSSALQEYFLTSSVESSAEKSLTLLPNPNTGRMTIQSPFAPDDRVSYRILNNNGVEIGPWCETSAMSSSVHIDVRDRDLGCGVYTVQLRSLTNPQQLYTTRFVLSF